MTLRGRQAVERLLLAGIAVILLLFGVPQAADSVLRLAGNLDQPPPPSLSALLAPGIEHRAMQLERLDDKLGDPRARISAGLLRLRLAVRPDAPLEETETRAAVEDLRQGLARAPANPLAWTALAHAQLGLGERDAARRALVLSLASAPHDPQLTVSRCQIGLMLWPDLGESEREQIRGEIAQAWKEQPQELLAIARAGGFGQLVASALEGAGQRAAFEKAFAAL